MKKITVVVALFLGIFLMTSCTNKAKIIKLNDNLATISDSLYNRGHDWGVVLGQDLTTTKDFSNLVPMRKGIQSFISVKRNEVKAMEDVGGSENFRKAILGFLDIEDGLVKGMESFEALNPNSTQEEIQAVAAKFQAEAEQETAALATVKKAQLEFAQKNNIKIIERK